MWLAAAQAHVQLQHPIPFMSKYNTYLRPDQVDYDMKNPLLKDGSDFSCKNHHLDRFGNVRDDPPSAQWKTNTKETFLLEHNPDAYHGGGPCQAVLSADNGLSWTVLHSYIGECPTASLEWEFRVPSDTPLGLALFGWTWFNKLGEREMYMNCAMVEILQVPRRAKACLLSL